MQIGDSVTQGAPLALSVGIVFFGAEGFEVSSVVHGEFRAQDTAVFVVEFEGVLTDSMLDPNAFGTLLKIRDDLALEIAVEFSSQKAHHITTGEGRHSVQDEGGADGSQGGRAFKGKVGGPLVFEDGPVVSDGKAFENPPVNGVEHAGEAVQRPDPSGAQLTIHQFLGFIEPRDPRETVFKTAVLDASPVHLACQPFAAVEADLNVEGEPGLDTGIHEAKLGINKVVINKQASSGAELEIQFLGAGVGGDLVAHARFDAGDYGDQSVGNPVFGGDFLSHSLLVGVRGTQVNDGTFLSEGCSAGSVSELLGNFLDISTEIFEQYLPVPEEALHSPRIDNRAQGATQDQSVEAIKNPDDFVGESLYKTFHGVPLFFGEFFVGFVLDQGRRHVKPFPLMQSKPLLQINQITEAIIGAAIEVHRALGPGLLESAYQECLARELTLRHIPFEREKPLLLEYKGTKLECGYRLDFLVADTVVVEVKAADALLPIHQAQLLTYMKLGSWRIGLLINFQVPVLKKGIKRLVLNLDKPETLP